MRLISPSAAVPCAHAMRLISSYTSHETRWLTFIFVSNLSHKTRLNSCTSCCKKESNPFHPKDLVSSVVPEGISDNVRRRADRCSRWHYQLIDRKSANYKRLAAKLTVQYLSRHPLWVFGRRPVTVRAISKVGCRILGCWWTNFTKTICKKKRLQEGIHIARCALILQSNVISRLFGIITVESVIVSSSISVSPHREDWRLKRERTCGNYAIAPQ